MRTEFFRFGLVSVVALGVDLSILITLKESLGLPALLSAACGFLCGAFTHYTLSIRFVFLYRRMSSRAAEALSFAALSAIG